MKIDTILCHVGPWSLDHYSAIASQLAPNATIRIVSGHPKCDEVGYFQKYYELVTRMKDSEASASGRERDIVLRCRLLRGIPMSVALKHLRAAWLAMGEMLDRERPDLILSETIDSYVMDVLYFQAVERGIHFIGLVPTFISGYFRISARGEYNSSRLVSATEAASVLDRLLQKSYRPDFIKNSDSKLIFYALGRWLRNAIKIPYFFIKRLNRSERFNYHNWATLIVARDWFCWFPSFRLGYSDWNAKISNSGKPIIYIPLQMIPEATVDYWCDDLAAVDYDSYLIKLTQHLSADFTLLIKEHPNVLGYRNPKLYHLLQNNTAIVFAPTAVNSHELIEAADAILVWTGSVGFEAAIRGKPVLTTCKPYYQIGPMFKYIDILTTSHEIKTFISATPFHNIDNIQQELITHVLSGSLPGRYIIDGTWSSTNPEHLQYSQHIAQQLKAHIRFNIESHS
jgi:hypothetical protein